MEGKLTIVPTPLGNLGDMTQRALDALLAADTICAEDTRVTGKLLAALGISGKHLERLDENVMRERLPEIVGRMQRGEVIAYCSDAGMPGVSDPGLRLVASARAADPSVQIEVLPGPTAAVTAYVASGTSATAFYFGGFFPRKEKERVEALERLRSLDAALIFYESPNRLVAGLETIAAVMPSRTITVCRELTKLHEEVIRAESAELARDLALRSSIKGEIVIVIDPPGSAEAAPNLNSARDRAAELASQGTTPKSIAKRLVVEFNISRNEAYKIALELGQ